LAFALTCEKTNTIEPNPPGPAQLGAHPLPIS
jgi:hypothetical protein